MTYTVTGYIDGVSYQATIGGDQPPDDTEGTDSPGVVTGSPNVMALLHMNDGRSFAPTVTSEAVPLDLSQPDSILPALQELTEVTSIEGDAPEDEGFDSTVIY